MTHYSNLQSALFDKQEKGYPHDFLFDEVGNLLSEGVPLNNYKVLEIINCECGATLYVVAAGGKQGTFVDHWEI